MSTNTLSEGVTGALAAFSAPLWVSSPSRLARLLTAPAPPDTAPHEPDRAVNAAFRVLRALARLPRSPWRNTCLYRSVAECLVLRSYGIPAHLEIGVQNRQGIVAHAWVSRDGAAHDPQSSDMQKLSFAR